MHKSHHITPGGGEKGFFNDGFNLQEHEWRSVIT